jgi:transposase
LKRRLFRRKIRQINPDKLVFLDEAGANISMGRSHGWARRGEELIEPRPTNWGTNLTMIGAIRRQRFAVLGTMFKTANADRFCTWLRRRLAPKLKRGDVVVLDNAKAHKDPRVRVIVEQRGAVLQYLPPYSYDFNPIEPAWSLTKKHIRTCAPRDRVALRRVARAGRRRVRSTHCEAFFEHCGYRRPLT